MAQEILEDAERGVGCRELDDRGLEGDPQNAAGECLLNRFAATWDLVRHQHGGGGGDNVHDADECLLGDAPPFPG